MNASMPSSVQPPHAAQNPLIWFALSFVFVATCVRAGAAVNAMGTGTRVYGRRAARSSVCRGFRQTRRPQRVLPLRSGCGNREREGGAPARRALDPDATAVRFDDALGDGKPEPGASTPSPRRLPESVKDMRQVLGRDPAARVRHPEHDLLISRRGAHRDPSRPPRELDRVADEVLEHLKESVAIAPDLGNVIPTSTRSSRDDDAASGLCSSTASTTSSRADSRARWMGSCPASMSATSRRS